MTREQFLQLPPTVALRLLFDSLDESTTRDLLAKEAPKRPLPPKYDFAIYRSEGVQWASETDLEGLRFWRDKALAPPSDPKYAELNRKRAETLARWIAWREWYPEAIWKGERDQKQGVAKPPSAKPNVYPRANGQQRQRAPQQDEEIDPNNW